MTGRPSERSGYLASARGMRKAVTSGTGRPVEFLASPDTEAVPARLLRGLPRTGIDGGARGDRAGGKRQEFDAEGGGRRGGVGRASPCLGVSHIAEGIEVLMERGAGGRDASAAWVPTSRAESATWVMVSSMPTLAAVIPTTIGQWSR